MQAPPQTIPGKASSKKDKRSLKHASFLSKIQKSSPAAPKRRRASKKLAANLDALADALPDTDIQHDLPDSDPRAQVNVIKQKTLRHKPGAMKRRQNLEKIERDRFAKNMAQMAAMEPQQKQQQQQQHQSGIRQPEETEQSGTANRWAALRSFISQTMEQQPVFRGQ